MMRLDPRVATLLALSAAVLVPFPVLAQEPEPSPEAEASRESAPEPALDPAWADVFRWRCIGPANMGGRITSIAVDEQDPTRYWVGTASAGLLATDNNGVTFEHRFDEQATASIGAVAVAPSNPDIVWVGTGESNPRNSVSWGDGVYVSTDGGETWQHTGLGESFQIGSIVVHPDDPDVVYVGALGRLWGPNEERGLYRTTDGGETWEKILYVDERTGVVDVAMHPADPETLLVATYERQRGGFDVNDPTVKWGPGSGLWRTTDGGETFSRVTEGLPSVDLGRISIDWYRADPDVVYATVESERIGKGRSDPGYLGVETQGADAGVRVTEVAEGGPAAAAGLQQGDILLRLGGEPVMSTGELRNRVIGTAAGATVDLEIVRDGEMRTVSVTLSAPPEPEEGERGRGRGRGSRRRGGDDDRPFGTRLGGQVANVQDFQGPDGHECGGVFRSDDGGVSWRRVNSLNPRPMYFSRIRVDPSDDQRVYVLGISMSRSDDGGATFTSDASRGVHSDQHDMWIDPENGRHMILGTDGGLYVTYDRCESWDHHNHMALGQFYHATMGPRRDYWVYGGLQDNGTWGSQHRSRRDGGIVNQDWIRIGGGDGFIVQVDREDPDQIYYESQYGGMGRTHLVTMDSDRISPPRPEERGDRWRFNWKTPFVLSNHNSRIYYCAGNVVFRSVDRGNDLEVISPEVTRTDEGSASALAESPRDHREIWVGTDDGALWLTLDGGHSWKSLYEPAEEPAIDPSRIGEATVLETGTGGPMSPPEAVLAAEAVGAAVAAVPAARADEGEPLSELLPGPRWVASIEPSRFADGRCYVAFDGHRSDDDAPYLLVTEDHGATWRALHGNLPETTTRVLREDLESEDVLWLGTEFGLWVSVDRGETWTELDSNLPTVAVHEIDQHPLSGEVMAATHGRSLWLLDATALRQMSADVREAPAHLFRPANAVLWQRLHSRGGEGARQFVGRNPASAAEIFFKLPREARGVHLEVRDRSGETLATLETPTDAGLHRVTWDLRREVERDGGSRRRWWWRRPRVDPGSYHVVLEVNGDVHTQPLVVEPDPAGR